MTTPKPLHVLIAGGGLSGLALAQGLIKDGHTCDVFERDADDSRKVGYYLHMNADGGEALRRCLPADLFELYAETSRRTYDRRESIVLDDQFRELSAQPHLGPPNDGERPHTGVHRRTLRSILRARLGDRLHPGKQVVGYTETESGVTVHLSDGSTAEGDVLVGADGIRSAVRGQRLPGTPVIDTGVRGLGVYGRTPLTADLLAQLPPHMYDGVIIAADRKGSRLLVAVFRPRQGADVAARAIAPDVALEPVDDYVMISCSVAPGTVIPPNAEWTADTPAMLRDAMLAAIEGWHPAAHALVANVELGSIFVIPFGFLEPAPPWEPSRVTLVGDAAHAMLPTLGLGANLALRDAAQLLDQLSAARRLDVDLVTAIGAYEQEMRDYVYPFMRMTMDHDRQFGGARCRAGNTPTLPRDDPDMRSLHHIGYWVADLESACTQWMVDLGVGPFEVVEHVAFESFELAVNGQLHHDVVFDHSAAFAAWGPLVVELGEVHAIDKRLATAYGYAVDTVSHVSWVVDDLAAESARLVSLGCRLINTARSEPIAVAWHEGGRLFPHPIEVHQSNDVIAAMYDRLTASHHSGELRA